MECEGNEPHSEICSDCFGEDCDECRDAVGESELAAFVSGGCDFDDGSDIGRWFRDEGCGSLRGCCPITRDFCTNDASLPDNCNCGDCGYPACGDCDCDHYGDDHCCTGSPGSCIKLYDVETDKCEWETYEHSGDLDACRAKCAARLDCYAIQYESSGTSWCDGCTGSTDAVGADLSLWADTSGGAHVESRGCFRKLSAEGGDSGSASGSFVYVDQAKSFDDARAYCRAHYHDLASIHSSSENAAVAALCPGECWIGGSDAAQEGTWTWSDSTAWDYENWESGEPNNAGGDEPYTVILHNSKWNDENRYGSYQFVCATSASGGGGSSDDCRSDICTDIGNDCCAPGAEARGCSIAGYEVQADWVGSSGWGDCVGTHGQESVYQCCPTSATRRLSDDFPAVCPVWYDEAAYQYPFYYQDDPGADDLPDDLGAFRAGFTSDSGTSYFVGLDALAAMNIEGEVEICAVVTPLCAASCVKPVLSAGVECPGADGYALTDNQKIVALVSGACGTSQQMVLFFSNPEIFYGGGFRDADGNDVLPGQGWAGPHSSEGMGVYQTQTGSAAWHVWGWGLSLDNNKGLVEIGYDSGGPTPSIGAPAGSGGESFTGHASTVFARVQKSSGSGGYRDEHGCIPSAGYTWCASWSTCVREWETPCPTSDGACDSIHVHYGEACSSAHGEAHGCPIVNVPRETWDYDLWSCDDLCGRVGGWCERAAYMSDNHCGSDVHEEYELSCDQGIRDSGLTYPSHTLCWCRVEEDTQDEDDHVGSDWTDTKYTCGMNGPWGNERRTNAKTFSVAKAHDAVGITATMYSLGTRDGEQSWIDVDGERRYSVTCHHSDWGNCAQNQGYENVLYSVTHDDAAMSSATKSCLQAEDVNTHGGQHCVWTVEFILLHTAAKVTIEFGSDVDHRH